MEALADLVAKVRNDGVERYNEHATGHCHAALGLRSDPWPNHRADEENQLQRVSFPA
jgi:hypothetical protein